MIDSIRPVEQAHTPNKSDSDGLTNGTCRGLYVGGAGAVKCVLSGGQTVTFTGLLAGVVYPFSITQIWDTGTDATDLLVLY